MRRPGNAPGWARGRQIYRLPGSLPVYRREMVAGVELHHVKQAYETPDEALVLPAILKWSQRPATLRTTRFTGPR